jgi:hypothetical protein
MNAVSASPDWASLQQAIAEMASSGRAEIHEAGEWLAEFVAFHWEIRYEGKNPLLHLWSDDRNLTRRLLGVKEQSPERIVLQVQRYGRAKPSQFEFLRRDAPRQPLRVVRERFRIALRRILETNFPDCEVQPLVASPDLANSFSDVYVRGGVREKERVWAVLAVRPGESATAVKSALSYGLLWLDWTRSHASRCAVEGLRVIVPEGMSSVICERVQGLSPSTKVEIYELVEGQKRLCKMATEGGNLESWVVPRSERDSLLNQARAAAASIHAIALHVPPSGNEVTVRLAPGGMEASLAFRGLEFARYSREGLFFGLGDTKTRLKPTNHADLDALMFQLDNFRSPLASDTRHRLYRAAPERWIETMILADPVRLDAHLDARHVYSQVPTLTQDRGIVDLLGVTRRGRLVVIEIKASEDLQTPVQALDYWLRIRRHQLAGDFARCGYFSGVELSSEPPLVWLVAPGLHFHPASEILARYLAPEIQLTRIGINESWRRGIKVVFRR